MPDWLSDALRDWGPATGLIVFVLTALGGGIAGLVRLVSSLFADGTVISKSRHQAETDFFREQLRLTQEASDRRIAELRQDIADLERDRDEWRGRFWRAAEAGQIILKQVTPPHGTHRSEIGK